MADQVLVLDHAWPDLDIERSVFDSAGITLVSADKASDGELLDLAADFDALMVNWRPLHADVIAAARRCRTIARFGVGVDNIDVETATAHGIVVSRVPDFCVDEVAEHALALILSLARRIVSLAEQTRAGGWSNSGAGPMYRIRGSVLGIVGWGSTAQALASRAVGIGMRVLVHSRTIAQVTLPPGVSAASSLLDLAARVDYLSVHVPLTEQTRGLVDETVLRAMRPTAHLINTARGPIIDTDALTRALREGWIAGAGVDVLDGDPPAPGNPLIGLPTAVVTPHAAFNSVEALHHLRHQAATNVLSALSGQAPNDLVNPEVLTQRDVRLTSGAR
jgi:D-3-phosphoglycerate dehydrogenase / 2-oxoglutarate reductase